MKYYTPCTICGEPVERSKNYSAVTCFVCKRMRGVRYARIYRSKHPRSKRAKEAYALSISRNS